MDEDLSGFDLLQGRVERLDQLRKKELSVEVAQSIIAFEKYHNR